MPTYKCTRFNRDANVPSRMCECGKQAITISKGRKWVCPEHGDSLPVKLCDCDGCQKSFAVLQRSNLRTRPWNTKGRSFERPNWGQYLFRKQRYERKYKKMLDKGGLPRHICPTCKKSETCLEPFKIRLDCREKIPKSKDPYAHCLVNEALVKGKGLEWWIRRACGGFWPSNPFTKDEELQDHIFYFHDSRRINLMPDVKVKDFTDLHQCRYIEHFCIFCHATWKSPDRILGKYGDKDNSGLGTATTFKYYHKG